MKIESVRYRVPFFHHRLVTHYVLQIDGSWYRVYLTKEHLIPYVVMKGKQVYDGIAEVIENCKFKTTKTKEK